jgi:hypothetical protein
LRDANKLGRTHPTDVLMGAYALPLRGKKKLLPDMNIRIHASFLTHEYNE